MAPKVNWTEYASLLIETKLVPKQRHSTLSAQQNDLPCLNCKLTSQHATEICTCSDLLVDSYQERNISTCNMQHLHLKQYMELQITCTGTALQCMF